MLEKNLTSLTYKHAFDYGFRYSDPKLVKKLKELADIPIEITKDPLHAGNAFYHFLDKKIMISPELKDNPFILAHELGHHELSKQYLNDLLQRYGTNYLGQFTVSSFLQGLSVYLSQKHKLAGTIVALLSGSPYFLTSLNEWFAWRNAKNKLLEAGFDLAKLEEFEKEKMLGLKTYLEDNFGKAVTSTIITFLISQDTGRKPNASSSNTSNT